MWQVTCPARAGGGRQAGAQVRETAGVPAWPASPAPPATGGWCWTLSRVRELAAVRAELRDHLASGGPGATPVADDHVDRLVLAFDELASNALRHGGGEVRAAVRTSGGNWLIEVRDGDPTRAPAPAVGRDPGLGGLGLYLIADVAVEHGWQVRDGHKCVWALIPRETAGSS